MAPDLKRELHFVTFNSANPHSSADARERKSLRAFVMRDYLRHKNDPSLKFAPAQVAARMTSHISRFRSTRPASSVKAKSPTKRVRKSRSSIPDRDRPRQLVPAPVARELALDRSSRQSPVHDLDQFDPFQTLTMDLSEPGTLELLQYYHTSFWANSYACNPEGRWLSVALMDPAIIHATLGLVAIHRRDCYSVDLTKVYFKHRGLAMRMIAERLSDPDESTSDATIGAIAILSTSDNEFDWPSRVQLSHSTGLGEVIALRGGIEGLASNRHVQRVVGWADMLQSAMHGTSLHTKIPSTIAEASRDDVGVPVRESPDGIILQDLPEPIARVVRQLRILSSWRARLTGERTAKLSGKFSDLLWTLEYTILEAKTPLDSSTPQSRHGTLSRNPLMVQVIGTAALIYSYWSLRNLAAPILFDNLSKRLMDQCSALMKSVQKSFKAGRRASGSPAPLDPVDDLEGDRLALLLWVFYLGFEGSRSDPDTREWFVRQTAQLCWHNGILSHASVRKHIQRVLPDAQEGMEALDGFWDQVEELMWVEIISIH